MGLRITLESKSLIGDSGVLVINGLPHGTYVFSSNGRELSRSKVDAETRFVASVGGFESFRKAIVEKNQLYFHRWRPQNVTYLTLFRKHEQGQNAKEVEEFDRLVAEKEREIAKLRQPVTRTYELIRVKPEAK